MHDGRDHGGIVAQFGGDGRGPTRHVVADIEIERDQDLAARGGLKIDGGILPNLQHEAAGRRLGRLESTARPRQAQGCNENNPPDLHGQ